MVVVFAVAFAVSGCASATSHLNSSQAGSTASTSRSIQHSSADVAESYGSLVALRHDATTVAVLQPTGATRSESIDGIPWTISTVNVLETVSGEQIPGGLGLRQLGSGDGSVPGPLASPADLYLAYLQPYRTLGGLVAGQYVVIGSLQGLFEDPTSDATAVLAPSARSDKSFARIDPDNTVLPAAISIAQASGVSGN